MLDTKNWTGTVELRGGELRQNGYRATSIDTVLDQASAVAALLEPQHRHLAAGWICLIGQPDIAGRFNSGVRIESAETFISALRSLPTVLDIVAVDVIAQYLKELLTGDRSPGLLTTKELEEASGGGASQSIQRRRGGVREGVAAGSHSFREARPQVPRRRKKRTGLAGAVVRLSLLVIGIVTLLNILDGVRNLRSRARCRVPYRRYCPTGADPVLRTAKVF